MTKYEELQAELEAEKERLTTEFRESAQEGDYVIFEGTTLGILIKRFMARGGQDLVFYPLKVVAVTEESYNYAMPLDGENIAKMGLVGKDFEKIDAFIQGAVNKYKQVNMGIPF